MTPFTTLGAALAVAAAFTIDSSVPAATFPC